jgi:hypothetical protein
VYDNIDFTAFAAAEPPKPAKPQRDPWATDLVSLPGAAYALQGPDGWYGAHVTKEPFPGVYTLVIQTIGAASFPVFEDAITWHRGRLAWRDSFYPSFHNLLGDIIHLLGWHEGGWNATEEPVPEDHWIDLCETGTLHGHAGRLIGLHARRAR